MFRVLYVSSASIPFTTSDLINLLDAARQANAEAHVTGMLVYSKGEFLQALEGPHAAVRDTFDRIQRDPRHREVVQLARGDGSPLFSKWSMGFSNLDNAEAAPGVVKINDRLNLRSLDALAAIDFLTASAAQP